MKLALLTTLAINTAVAYAADDVGFFRGTIPKLFGADQLIDVEAHCEGCQPDYCYLDEPDYDCYKSGYPKCCDKTNKGNCPNNNKPTCEVVAVIVEQSARIIVIAATATFTAVNRW
eukprot:CAMPEP_0172328358 /NCGR_PEP_ID=MMETSP1058-20130122/60313_1 /TAXON_ID=83371 /ORGANISM="Detonula confervacea, Strain CCMP 353" /LENGTH=115 /DNA_ID=CAMNT_0013045471 /DNA_START=246 /DNA_END=590 /DNA_ORIENTATION=+